MQQVISLLSKLLDPKYILQGTALHDRALPKGICPNALLLPKDTTEVANILKVCHAHKQALVPCGGFTGLVDGTRATEKELAISLARMNSITDIDIQSRTMTVEAGASLQAVQEAAENAGLLFPLDLGARGSATIGGNVATNAGGNRVIRYGMMREQILGMEVVLADGSILSNMNKVLKNNTGYDLKQLFVGAEGTLGIVTKVVLKLKAKPISQNMAFIGFSEFTKVTEFLNYIDAALGGTLSAFEVLWHDFYQLVTSPPAKATPPLKPVYKYYLLLESMGGHIQHDNKNFLDALAHALEQELIEDAVIAQSQKERDAMWAIRDDVTQVGRNRPIVTFDISVPLNHMESYVNELCVALKTQWPQHTCMIFGHLGDSNLHIIIGVGDNAEATKTKIVDMVYVGLPSRGGSISAEHGIGIQKRNYLKLSRTHAEIKLMKMLKHSFDPQGILNPGKIFE